jgi:outer membrane protein OmpA-like peptidoglycan-associated protein
MKPTVRNRCLLSLLVLALGGLFACVSGSKLRADVEVLKRDIAKARESGAYKCAPRDLALAESNTQFAEDELDQGDWLRASEHVKVAISSIKRAIEDSKDCGPKKVLIKEPPKVVAIAKTDKDGDGIFDVDDQCPDVPGLPEYQGCPPPDTDGDGLIDPEDKCPKDPGPKENQGCPVLDRDKDGIPDVEDACPDDPGPPETKGCPDRDKDTVPDKDDACPDDPGKVELKGCPDRDGDGIIDKDDACPDEPGPAMYQGCPDRDGDGIIDKEDKCPDEPGPPDSPQGKGCPRKFSLVKVNREKKQIEIKEKIYFAYNKWDILPKSFGLLNQVAQVLKDYPTMKISIEGHTDSDGPDAYNQMLSEKRAGSVKDYLIKQGIEEERLQSVGFGESRPIASNRTPRGKEANRRVEFRIVSE